MPLFCWFHHFLDSRAEFVKLFRWYSKRWHQKDILKLTDLYYIEKKTTYLVAQQGCFLICFTLSEIDFIYMCQNTILICVSNVFFRILKHCLLLGNYQVQLSFWDSLLTSKANPAHLDSSKGQLNSEWIYEVIVSPKMQTKNYKDFCPTIQTRIVALFLVMFWWV